MNKKKKWALDIIQRLQAEYPDAGTMLKYSSQFELLVAVVLSAQSTDAQVNRVTSKMFEKYCTPEDFAQMDIVEMEELVHGVGLYKGKAKNLKNLSEILLKKFDGKVPSDFNALMELPGVGRKTANVIMSVAFNQPGLGVDTHVQRVANRLGLVTTKNPDQTENQLKAIIPVDLWSKAHHQFIFHGRKTCMARKPNCSQCVLGNLCKKVLDN
ncbi:MAG: endonuclease III [Firmicutes bacterium HGW-Firmicutes-15]|nr:MAG: endonuclease III [Firmicutes bacterium HGW-Firmicutes-15]